MSTPDVMRSLASKFPRKDCQRPQIFVVTKFLVLNCRHSADLALIVMCLPLVSILVELPPTVIANGQDKVTIDLLWIRLFQLGRMLNSVSECLFPVSTKALFCSTR